MYTINNAIQTLGESLANVTIKIVSFLPSLVVAIVLVLCGWFFGKVLGRAAAHLIALLRIDKALEKAGLIEMINGVKFSVSSFAEALIKWAIITSFLMAATQVVGLDSFAGLLWIIISYIPNVLVAALILVSSFLLADFVAKMVTGSAKAAGISHGMAGLAARYSIVIVGILAALSQLKIAGGFMDILFAGIVASLSLAIGLSFGLGGKDAASRAIERIEKSI